MRTIKQIIFIWFLLTMQLLFNTEISTAQQFQCPNGETLLSKVKVETIGKVTIRFAITNKHVWYTIYKGNSWNYYSTGPSPCRGIPGNEYSDIVDYLQKDSDIYVQLADGRVKKVNYKNLILRDVDFIDVGNIKSGSSVTLKDFVGDDFYVITNTFAYVSRDNGINWAVDTSGINGSTPNSICLDKNQNVYLGTSRGLFYQTAKGTTWTKLTSFPLSAVTKVYIDSQQRIFVVDQSALYVSTDNGKTFSNFNGGVYGFLYVTIANLGSDNAGNIYAVTGSGNTGNALWRSDGGTSAFVEIDSPITSLVSGFNNTDIYNFIGGDSILYTGTAVGLFTSRDHGKTWKNETSGIQSEQNYSLVKANNGNYVVSTGLGIFYRTAKNDSVWTQTFPSTGYLSGLPVFEDKNGTIYTYGANLIPYNTLNSPKLVVKSTDGGQSWSVDTAGISTIGMNSWYVDETGTQHAAKAYTGPVQVFSKASGGSWQPDNNGLATTTSEQVTTCWGSDGNGTIYVGTYSYSGRVLWKKTGTGAWSLDTVGLKGTSVYAIAKENNGTILAATANGLYQNSGSGWKQTLDPTNKGAQCFTVSVDASGAVWASYGDYNNGNSTATGDGVYFSTNNCASWTSKNISGPTFREIVPVGNGDTAYGVSYYDGIYILTKKAGTGIKMVENSLSNSILKVYPSPAYNYLQVELDKSINSERTGKLEIIDLRGNKLSEINISGVHQTIDIHNLAAGIYIVRYSSGEMTTSQRFVKAK